MTPLEIHRVGEDGKAEGFPNTSQKWIVVIINRVEICPRRPFGQPRNSGGLNEFEWTQSGVSSGYASQLSANWDTAVMADVLSLSLPNAVSGMGKLIVYTASDSSTAIGRCGKALAADTHTVHLPFVGAIMVGSTTPTWM